jgi:hypothetical protein
MVKRNRRTTVCNVEQLEGRVVLSAIAVRAAVAGASNALLNLYGYTTAPLEPGDKLEIKVVEWKKGHVHNPASSVVGREVVTDVGPPLPYADRGGTGSFLTAIRVKHHNQHFYPGGEAHVEMLLLGLAPIGKAPPITARYSSVIDVSEGH